MFQWQTDLYGSPVGTDVCMCVGWDVWAEGVGVSVGKCHEYSFDQFLAVYML